ncbi:MAG: hypothetical protein R3C41_21565 [Calditrichia bacterium]|nr:hypothetical protein [Calditrichota bacterium]MCB0268079.1 hypothetical protein [Calditrichota bacterium]MCB0287786.1 hypothetical protein [Calditrichota bacterium]
MNNGFKFRLNKVLEVKDVEFKQQQKDLSSAAQDKMNAYQQLLEKQSSSEAFARELGNVRFQNAGDMHLNFGHFQNLIEEVQEQEQQLFSMEERENLEREKLLKVQRERKVLEKLREKELEKFHQDFLKQSQNDIDEMAILGNRRGLWK